MSKLKSGIVAGITMLSFSFSSVLPSYAIQPEETEPIGGEASGEVDPSGESEQPDTLRTADVTALSSVTVNPSSVNVAIGEEKEIVLSYNEGFDIANLSDPDTNVAFTSGDYEYTAYVGFKGEYNEETHNYERDFNSIYVYGNQMGTAVFTVTAMDQNGNTATADIAVTVRDALGSGYAAVTHVDDEGMTDTLYEAGASFGTPIEGGRKLNLALVPMTDQLQALDENLKAVLNITVLDKDGNIIPVDNNNIEFWFGINKDVLEEEYQYYQIAYIKDGKIAEYFDVYDFEDDGWGYMMSFLSSHCSDYGILASNTPFESAESRNAAIATDEGNGAPNTGAPTKSDETVSVSSLGTVAAVVILAALVVCYKKSKRGEE